MRASLLVNLTLLVLLPWPQTQISTGSTASTDHQAMRRTPVVEVFETAKGSVVNIAATHLVQIQDRFGRIDSIFEQLFDLPIRRPRTRQLKSVGSGFVLHPAGYIVTNAHVVARTVERNVIFDNQREYDAQVIAMDREQDLAVLKIDVPQKLKPIRLGQSSDLMIGETVIAIGNPLGYQHTVTAGVVSALDRRIESGDEVLFDGLIQTDAPINPGNSGGPLLNVVAELIGITTAIRPDAQNIGFAIPVDRLRELLPTMLDVERRYRIRTGMRLDNLGQAKVQWVQVGGPAEVAGIQVGDIITQMDLQPVGGPIDYHIALLGRQPGDRIALALNRNGRRSDATLVLAERPLPDGAALLKRKFGIEAEPMTAKMARAMGMRQSGWLIVTRGEANRGDRQLHIERGDVIVQIGRYQPTSLEHVGELLDPVRPGQKAAFAVLRVKGNRMYRLTVNLTAR